MILTSATSFSITTGFLVSSARLHSTVTFVVALPAAFIAMKSSIVSSRSNVPLITSILAPVQWLRLNIRGFLSCSRGSILA